MGGGRVGGGGGGGGGGRGGDECGRGRAHAIEEGEVAGAVPEEAQHRHHSIDGIEQRGRRHEVASGERAGQRQKVQQRLDQRAGIAADVASVRQDLPRQLV